MVKAYERIARARSREVPLAHPPGRAQVDFGECVGIIGGVRMKLQVFCFDLPQSDACFIKAYPAETTGGCHVHPFYLSELAISAAMSAPCRGALHLVSGNLSSTLALSRAWVLLVNSAGRSRSACLYIIP